MADERLAELRRLGQSPWLDTISRGMLASGEMQALVDAGLTGVTANPSIFEKSITGSHDYDDAIAAFLRKGGNANDLYEELATGDVGAAADMFRPVYDAAGGVDGFVSLEVSPRLAYDTQGTIAEARRFWQRLDRPNVFIKVPATREGLPAIQQLIAEGINVNVTLLFGLPRYRQVADAYLTGLEQRVEQALPLDNVHSVASFFLSRIDTLLDPVFEKLMEGDDQRSYIALECSR